MKPFSPMYFIKENRLRCILLIFMITLGYIGYLGGLYITNVFDTWALGLRYEENSVCISGKSEDIDYREFNEFEKELSQNKDLTILKLGKSESFNWKTIMGFESGNSSITFRSVDDFKIYCEQMGIDCDFQDIKNGSMILTDKFAKNRKLKIGDSVDKDFDKNIHSQYTLDAVIEEDGYMQYFINDDEISYPFIIVMCSKNDGSKMYDTIYSLQEKYNVYVNDGLKDDVNSQFKSINMIYTFIIMFMSVILAVTINAAFVGMYQRRNFEFAVYRAIGISKKRIMGKIIGELLCMDLIAVVAGGAVFFIIIYIINNMVLYPEGLYLRYFHPTALKGFMLCDISVIVPLIITRCHQMSKADISQY